MPDSPPDEIKNTTPETPVSETPKAETPAVSPPADGQDGKSPTSTLDAVMAAIKPKTEAGSSDAKVAGKETAQETSSTEAKPEGEDDGEELGEVTSDELNRYTSKTRRRVKQLIEQRDTYRGQVESLTPKADALDRVTDYIAKAGLTKDEVNLGFEIMQAMKNDPFRANELLAPYVTKLQEVTGRILPVELQEQVRGGYISEAAAQELATLRARNALAQASAERQTQTTLASQRQADLSAVQTELTTWETSKAATDPDYQAKKATLVQRFLKAKWADGDMPRTAEAARKQADDVLKEVETHLRSVAPPKQELRPIQGGTTSPAARPAVTSTLDAIRRAVGR